MVSEHQGEHESQWATIASIAVKIGCTPETLRKWVRQTEINQGIYMDWSRIQRKVFSTTDTARGMLYTPGADKLEKLEVRFQDNRYLLNENPFGDPATFVLNK